MTGSTVKAVPAIWDTKDAINYEVDAFETLDIRLTEEEAIHLAFSAKMLSEVIR